ncbi:ABC transporter ATP-binding protein [Leisingera thetidis]|uniref:ABC transporter ATP-binding protein n=1 Tax=Leisingera thetidis TaxID=2930199 RepID=UPI0021F6FFDE|nr:ABC transporter ATP-binding protein [Leisingera thetidis]
MENTSVHTQPQGGAKAPVLSICDLTVTLPVPSGTLTAVNGLNLDLHPGETVGIVGESGSGKSMTALAVMGLLPPAAASGAARLELCGRNLLEMNDRALARDIRGQRAGMIFQEPMTSLNPVYTVGRQLTETVTLHGGSHAKARTRALELMDAVGIPDPAERFSQYPHQFSGGQRQRLMIAMALMNEPDLLIADEPTTALDVTIQAQVLELLKDLQQRLGIAMVLISHDFGVVARYTDKVVVMLKGDVVETGATAEVLKNPQHGYTRRLLASIPHAKGRSVEAVKRPSAIEVQKISKTFHVRRGLFGPIRQVKASQDVSLQVGRGETLALVGESGSGKSTLSRMMLGLMAPDGGRILFNGTDVRKMDAAARARLVQPVFQDPFSSLNPRRSVREIIRQPLDIHGIGSRGEREQKVRGLMEQTGLSPRFLHAFPNQMSGGQRQRVAIARALILRPEILICDEPTSALDVSIQAQVLDLLDTLKAELDLTMVLITHDLGVVEQIADRVVVLKDGAVVEQALVQDLFARPQQDYTKRLLASVPRLEHAA